MESLVRNPLELSFGYRTNFSKAKSYLDPMLLTLKTIPLQDLQFGGSQLREMDFIILAYRAPKVKKILLGNTPKTNWSAGTPVLRSPDPNLEIDTAIAVNATGEPVQEVDFMSFTPDGGYFVSYIDGRYVLPRSA